MGRVVIGMDPHKRSATIEAINSGEEVLATGRSGTDRDGYQAMLAAGRKYSNRVWAVEGCNGVGRHLAQRLVADGESVLRHRTSAPRPAMINPMLRTAGLPLVPVSGMRSWTRRRRGGEGLGAGTVQRTAATPLSEVAH